MSYGQCDGITGIDGPNQLTLKITRHLDLYQTYRLSRITYLMRKSFHARIILTKRLTSLHRSTGILSSVYKPFCQW